MIRKKLNRFFQPGGFQPGYACNPMVINKKKLSSQTCLSRFDHRNAGRLQKHLPGTEIRHKGRTIFLMFGTVGTHVPECQFRILFLVIDTLDEDS